LTFNLTQKQITHTVHIVFIYFTLLKVMMLHVQYLMSIVLTQETGTLYSVCVQV